MIIQVGDDITINELQDGSLHVTRPCILGGVESRTIHSPYSAEQVADYYFSLANRKAGLIQKVFPEMSNPDREFLLSGITPQRWLLAFPTMGEE